MKQSDMLIDIIDKRIDDYIKSARLISRYIGKIISINENQTAKVTILGFNTIFTFPYRDYLIDKIKEGDNVFIESKIGNLSSGIIVDRFYGKE